MLERKGFGIRLGAYAIDLVAIVVVASVIAIVVSFVVPRLTGLLVLAAVVGYAFVEIAMAQSPGKMALGMKVAREDGSPASQDQLVRRTLIKYAPLLVHYGIAAVVSLLGVSLIGAAAPLLGALASLGLAITLLAISWGPLQTVRQSFWDIKAKTAVFGKPAAVAAGFAPVMPGQPVPPVTGQGVPPVPGVPAQA